MQICFSLAVSQVMVKNAIRFGYNYKTSDMYMMIFRFQQVEPTTYVACFLHLSLLCSQNLNTY